MAVLLYLITQVNLWLQCGLLTTVVVFWLTDRHMLLLMWLREKKPQRDEPLSAASALGTLWTRLVVLD